MPEIKHANRPRNPRKRRRKPSQELKPTTLHFESYAPSDIAARHPRKAKGLALAGFAILAALVLPVLDRWYIDWRSPERLIVDDLTTGFNYIEDELCGHFQRGTITVRALPQCDGACSNIQTANMINVARASDFVNIVCHEKEADPERNVDAIFTAMTGG